MVTNTSIVPLDSTAHTNLDSANQRARYIHKLGGKKVIELCAGPSLKDLEQAYSQFDIECWGNDIEVKYQLHYPQGKWLIGSCFDQDLSSFDTIVFAPPLSTGCTGRREDSLSINQVTPSYYDFIDLVSKFNDKLKVMVLPARSLSTRQDKSELYKLLSQLESYTINPLTEGTRQIRKYVDIVW